MREKEIAQAIVKLIQDWGESILNDELLFRVMLDDSLTDEEKKIFHCLDGVALKKICQAFENTQQNGNVNLGDLRAYLKETTDMKEQWLNCIISVFQSVFSEVGSSNFDEAAFIKKEAEQVDNAKEVAKVTASDSGIVDNIQVSIGQEIKLGEGDTIATLDFESVRQKAEQGDSDAQYNLGEKYFVENNYKEAVKWLRLSAEKNHDAEFLLGGCYYNGYGVEVNTEKAYKLWKRSEKWNYYSQYWLGHLFYHRKDYEQAVYWLQKFLKSVSNVWFASWRDDAYFLLGECYYYGRGVAKDEEKAFDYWIKAHSKEAIDRLEKCFPIKYHEFQEDQEELRKLLENVKNFDDLFSN